MIAEWFNFFLRKMKRATNSKRSNKRKRSEISNDISEDNDLLEGLTVDGEYIKIDQNLLKRLKTTHEETSSENEDDQEDVNELLQRLFPDCPEYIDTLQNGSPVTLEDIKKYDESLKKNHWSRKMGEMIANIPTDLLALDRSGIQNQNYEYRYKPVVQPRVTDQYHSGRCWLFAGLNCLRYGMQFKYNLDEKFEFSAAYLFFWDKIERANTFLESMWSLRDRPLHDRYLMEVFTSPDSHFIQDGGYWQHFANLAQKYGLVPKNNYNDSYNCLCSDDMNDKLIKILNNMVLEIRNSDFTQDEFDSYKDDSNRIIYDLVVKFMGKPPKKFTWQYKEADGTYKEMKNITPFKFFRVCVPHQFETKMVFIHDPRYPEYYYHPCNVEFSGWMVGCNPSLFINLPLDVLKRATAESLIAGEPCWFACDVGACLDAEAGTMDTKRFNYRRVLGYDVEGTKADMLKMKTSVPTHAMVINGVDMDPIDEMVGDNENDETEEMEEKNDLAPPNYKKWRVENSWGINTELAWHPDQGCWQMTDEWFDKYVYMVTLDLKYFSPEVLQKIKECSSDPFIYKPWDAFGCVAMKKGCSNCKKHSFKNSFKKPFKNGKTR